MPTTTTCILRWHAYYDDMPTTTTCLLQRHAYYHDLPNTTTCLVRRHAFNADIPTTMTCLLRWHAFIADIPTTVRRHAYYVDMPTSTTCLQYYDCKWFLIPVCFTTQALSNVIFRCNGWFYGHITKAIIQWFKNQEAFNWDLLDMFNPLYQALLQ